MTRKAEVTFLEPEVDYRKTLRGMSKRVYSWLTDQDIKDIYDKKAKQAHWSDDYVIISGDDIIKAGLTDKQSPAFLTELSNWYTSISIYQTVRCKCCGTIYQKLLGDDFRFYVEWKRIGKNYTHSEEYD